MPERESSNLQVYAQDALVAVLFFVVSLCVRGQVRVLRVAPLAIAPPDESVEKAVALLARALAHDGPSLVQIRADVELI